MTTSNVSNGVSKNNSRLIDLIKTQINTTKFSVQVLLSMRPEDLNSFVLLMANLKHINKNLDRTVKLIDML